MAVLETFELRIRVRTPLHVGGQAGPLTWGDGFLCSEAATFVLSEHKIASHGSAGLVVQEMMAAAAAGRTVRLDRLSGVGDIVAFAKAVKQYEVAGAVRVRERQALPILRALPRHPAGEPYLPGSALKGALRLALLDSFIQADLPVRQNEQNQEVLQLLAALGSARDSRERRRAVSRLRAAGSQLDERLRLPKVGEGPHGDLLRVLRIGDSKRLPADCVQVIEVRWLSIRRPPLPRGVFVECFIPNTEIVLPLTIDKDLLRAMGDVRSAERWLGDLQAAATRFTRRQWKAEQRQCADRFPELQMKLAKDANLRIGWGGGLLGTTLATHLDDATVRRPMLDALQSRRLQRPGWPAPKSRRVVASGAWSGAPFGWVTATYARTGGK